MEVKVVIDEKRIQSAINKATSSDDIIEGVVREIFAEVFKARHKELFEKALKLVTSEKFESMLKRTIEESLRIEIGNKELMDILDDDQMEKLDGIMRECVAKRLGL